MLFMRLKVLIWMLFFLYLAQNAICHFVDDLAFCLSVVNCGCIFDSFSQPVLLLLIYDILLLHFVRGYCCSSSSSSSRCHMQ
jgi:hypothetical protein